MHLQLPVSGFHSQIVSSINNMTGEIGATAGHETLLSPSSSPTTAHALPWPPSFSGSTTHEPLGAIENLTPVKAAVPDDLFKLLLPNKLLPKIKTFDASSSSCSRTRSGLMQGTSLWLLQVARLD